MHTFGPVANVQTTQTVYKAPNHERQRFQFMPAEMPGFHALFNGRFQSIECHFPFVLFFDVHCAQKRHWCPDG